MLSKALLYVAAALAILSAALGFGLWRSVAANGSLRAERDGLALAAKQAQEQRKLDEALLTRRRAEIVSERRKSATLAEALRTAQERSPEWSGAVVPPEVQEALGGAVGGLHE